MMDALIDIDLVSLPQSFAICLIYLVKYLACFNGKFMSARAPHENFRDETVMV